MLTLNAASKTTSGNLLSTETHWGHTDTLRSSECGLSRIWPYSFMSWATLKDLLNWCPLRKWKYVLICAKQRQEATTTGNTKHAVWFPFRQKNLDFARAPRSLQTSSSSSSVNFRQTGHVKCIAASCRLKTTMLLFFSNGNVYLHIEQESGRQSQVVTRDAC